ncbi:uncharacterized protein RJT20DRAFT_54224 [Scheffersomyces xylosifermentans]|uniref:uncharacterized protein n=1 Tax=Scheffersomyces xylosifermentans TaxID=1304137 RepID=UPI00315CCBD2
MGDQDFVHLKPRGDKSNGSNEGSDVEDDDATSTLLGEDDSNAHKFINADDPATLMYMPKEGRFSHDSHTLVEGQSGGNNGNLLASSSKSSNYNSRSQSVNASLQQLKYNENRISLDRSINQTIELMYELSSENKERPIFYPAEIEDDNNVLLNSKKAHLALVRNGTSKAISKAKISHDESKDEKDTLPEFKILKLNLKIGHSGQSGDNLVSNLDKKSIASLLEKKITQQVKYLLNLKDRVDDTSSKVFVTGDLNAGKSTFCNALLRRKILPEDQQPCTSVFCEVIDASRENNSIEEVHAVPIGKEYNVRDETTYEIHPLKALEDLVYDCDRFSLLKVYVLDNRSLQESLLHNGVIDIKLIDAPGLNMDSYQTTQVFSRQEEIDLVVFVVNSENHFTLSAKEFIAAAAAEKRYVFIVSNRFDNIKDKEKCKKKILDQVKNLSPDSYKSASDFVHFVSSTDVFKGGDDPDDDDHNDDRDYNDPDFDHLEASLRKFILEKRAISKLLPAKSYLLNLLNDLQTLSTINEKIYSQEKDDKVKELNSQVAPKYNEMMIKQSKIGDSINNLIEITCTDIYNESKKDILKVVNQLGDEPVVPFPGIQYMYEYARETQAVMVDKILASVQACEDRAKEITSLKVEEVIKFGQNTLGEEFLHDKVFRSDLMFTRKRDTIKRHLSSQIDISDFFDPSWDSCLHWLGIPKDYVSAARNQIDYFNPVSALATIPTNIVALKSQIPTQITLQTLYASGKILTTGALIRKMYDFSYVLTPTVVKKIALPVVIGISGFSIYYLISDMPNAFPRKQARRIKKQIYELDYPHVNSTRVANECRQVLNYPSRQVMNNFQTSIDKRAIEKETLEKEIKDAELSSGYFKALLGKIAYQRKLVVDIDLESVYTVD